MCSPHAVTCCPTRGLLTIRWALVWAPQEGAFTVLCLYECITCYEPTLGSQLEKDKSMETSALKSHLTFDKLKLPKTQQCATWSSS